MLRRSTISRIALPAATLLAAGMALSTLSASAAPTTAEECVQSGLVWVHVQYDDVVTGACAEEFDTASEALLSTGLTTDTGAWLSTVDGRTADGTDAREYWGVWTQSPADDDTYTVGWEFAEVGVTELELSGAMVLGVELEPDWDVYPAVAPSVNPVEGVVLGDTDPIATPSPTPTVTPSIDPTPIVTATPTPTPTIVETIAPVIPTATADPIRPGLPSTGR